MSAHAGAGVTLIGCEQHAGFYARARSSPMSASGPHVVTEHVNVPQEIREQRARAAHALLRARLRTSPRALDPANALNRFIRRRLTQKVAPVACQLVRQSSFC